LTGSDGFTDDFHLTLSKNSAAREGLINRLRTPMPKNTRRFVTGLTATAGGLLATAFLSSAFAHADVTTFSIVPDPEDGPSQITAIGGVAPFDQTITYTGLFNVDGGAVNGEATYYTDIFGLYNVELESMTGGVFPNFIDQLNFGSGYENVYTDSIGTGPDGANSISDTLITPFGEFNIPTTFDAAAVLDLSNFAPVAASSASSLLETDFTSWITELGALF
jgi:hypothetical protein